MPPLIWPRNWRRYEDIDCYASLAGALVGAKCYFSARSAPRVEGMCSANLIFTRLRPRADSRAICSVSAGLDRRGDFCGGPARWRWR